MPVRPPGSDHQAVGHGALAFEVDENDVLGLVVVQAGQDQLLQSLHATLVVLRRPGVPGGDRRRTFLRTWRSCTGQRGAALMSERPAPYHVPSRRPGASG